MPSKTTTKQPKSISYEEAMSKRGTSKTVAKSKTVSKKAESQPKRKMAMPQTRSAVKQVGSDAKRVGRKVQKATKDLPKKTVKAVDKAVANKIKDPTGIKRVGQRAQQVSRSRKK